MMNNFTPSAQAGNQAPPAADEVHLLKWTIKYGNEILAHQNNKLRSMGEKLANMESQLTELNERLADTNLPSNPIPNCLLEIQQMLKGLPPKN